MAVVSCRGKEIAASPNKRNTASSFELRFAILTYYMRESSHEDTMRDCGAVI